MTEGVRSTVYLNTSTDDEQMLAIETCPGFAEAKQRALGDVYEIKRCPDCRLEASFDPNIKQLMVKGFCPKQ